MDQDRAPILDALIEYHRRDRYGFTPPAHRQGRGADPRVREVLGVEPFRNDVLISSGLMDRLSSEGYLEDAEALMADAVGAEHAFFSTCGSSLSVKAAMLAVAGHAGSLIMSRDAHKSVVAGLIFAGTEPRWVSPRWDARLHLAHPPSPEQIEEAWERHPDSSGVLLVSPSPYGTCAEVEAIAEICHRRGKPLIVDEAWGAHLPFSDKLPPWAMNAGADVCVVSVHKMGAGFEQGSVFHHRGDLLDFSHLAGCADLLMTTSPSVLLYAAIDGWRRQMVEDGTALLGHAIDVADSLRTEIDRIPGMRVLHDELIGPEASHELDPLQILTDVTALGISGYQAADWLREHAQLDTGLSDHARILTTISMADNAITEGRLISALRELAGGAADMPRPEPVRIPPPPDFELEMAMLPRDAFFAEFEDVPAEQAVGRIGAEQITPYPPGIPVIVPGERISQEVVTYLRSGLEAGMALPDPANPELETIRVVR